MEDKNNIDYGQLMTGSLLTGVQNTPNVKPNVEVEDGEYVQFPDGSVAKALGDKHENGGVKLIAPNMTEVLSNTKDAPVSKELVKKLKKEYGMDNISTNDTYSKVLDKYARKIGYTKIINQEADLFNQVKKNTENALSEGSLRINNEYLAKKIYNLQSEKQPLQNDFSEMFSVLFGKQQEEKKGNEKIIPPLQGEELTEDQKFRLGGRVGEVESLAAKYGISSSRAYEILSNSNALPKFDGGGVVWTDFNKYQQNYQNIPTYGAGQIDQQGERLLGIINKAQAYGDLGSVNVGSQQEQDQTAGLYQKWLYEKVPAVAEDYSSTMPPTKQGMEYLVKNNILTEDDLSKIGVKVPKRAGQVLGFESGQLSEDKIKEVNNLIQEKLSSPELKKEYLRNNFIDNKWFFRAPEIQTVRFKNESEKEATLKDYTKVADNVYKSSKTGLYFVPQVDVQPVPPAQIKPKEQPAQQSLNTSPIVNDIVQPFNTNGNRLYQMPDQRYLPPSALQAESMYDTELGRIDPVRLGIEDTIRRNQDNTQFLASQLKSLPPTVAAGIMASAIAQSQQSENQAINQVHQINAQNIAQAEQFNVRQSDIEETTNNASKLNYEQRALLGLSKTDQDIRNYYNANREININNFREQQWMNTASNLFPQYSIGMSGTDVVFDPTTQTYFKTQNPYYNQAIATQQQNVQPKVQEKKK